MAIAAALLEQLGLAETPLVQALASEPETRGKLLDRAGRAHDRLIATKKFWR